MYEKEEYEKHTHSMVVSDVPDCPECLRKRIAILEAKVEQRITQEEVVMWLAEYHGRYREKTLMDWVAEKRERENK